MGTRIALWVFVLAFVGIAVGDTQAQPSTNALDTLFSTYVDANGYVEYEALHDNREDVLAPLMASFAEARPDTLRPDAQRAFWLNAYNVLTLALIGEHYPVDSIWETTPGARAAPTEENPFEGVAGVVAGDSLSLDAIQYRRTQPLFEDDPRYHMALVCAAVSCPPLRQEAYRGSQLNGQLDAQTRRFIQTTAHNDLSASQDTVRLSTIFKWYQEEFGGTEAAVQQFLAPYVDAPTVAERLHAGAYVITYTPYDWSLNASSP